MVNRALIKRKVQISAQLSSCTTEWERTEGSKLQMPYCRRSAEFFGITQGSGLFHLGAFAQDGISSSAAHLPTLTNPWDPYLSYPLP